MIHIPYEKMSVTWNSPQSGQEESFLLNLPWVSMEYDVSPGEKDWIFEATQNIHTNSYNQHVQKFMDNLKDYPVGYLQPRPLKEFEGQELQEARDITVDSSTPKRLIETLGCPIEPSLKQKTPSRWSWDQELILSKSIIPGTDLYDPVSLVTYLICYRLDWESETWSGTNGMGNYLESLLGQDEEQFFRAIGWITKQSWYVTTESINSLKPALTHFPKNGGWVEHFMTDEMGHYKFMEQVFEDLELNKDDFPVGDATK